MRVTYDLGEFRISLDQVVAQGELSMVAISVLGINVEIDKRFPPKDHQFRGTVIRRALLDTYQSRSPTFVIPRGLTSTSAVYHAINQVVFPEQYNNDAIHHDPVCVVLVYDPQYLKQDVTEEYRAKFEFTCDPKGATLALLHWKMHIDP